MNKVTEKLVKAKSEGNIVTIETDNYQENKGRIIGYQSKLSHSSISDFIKYGKYEVVAENPNVNETHVIVVRALNKISAIEKAAKRLNDANGFIITVRRL